MTPEEELLREIFEPYNKEAVYPGLKRRHLPGWLVMMNCIDVGVNRYLEPPPDRTKCYLCFGILQCEETWTLCHEAKQDLVVICRACEDHYRDNLLLVINHAIWAEQHVPENDPVDPRIKGW